MRLLPIMLLMLPAVPSAHATAARLRPTVGQDLVIIVNPAAHVSHLTRSQVIDIFMGRLRQLPTGAPALPIDLAGGAARAQFYGHLVHWSLVQVSSYWARLVFSGQASPPYRAQNARAAVQLVADNPNAIAYVPRTAISPRVRIVLDLGRH
jgi:ABC-type phosphate transport system substrate-binding protein